jgi:quercetin dioxygenase-like cupin family protein
MQAVQTIWQPDESVFDKVHGEMRGIWRVKSALSEAGIDMAKTLLTSRHPAVVSLVEKLTTEGMPKGFTQNQLPILFSGENMMYFVTSGMPGAVFPEHSHKRDDGLRLVIAGSIFYGETQLVVGDWMYVPRGASYSFVAGEQGCTLFHVYSPSPHPQAVR